MFERLKQRLAGDTPAWAEDDEFADNNVVVRPQRRRKHGTDAAAQEIMDYLKQYEDEYISHEDIVIELGITKGYVSALLTRLIEDGAISRKGKRGEYTYKVNRKHPQKGAPRGRAVAKKSPEAQKRIAHLRETAVKQELGRVSTDKSTRVLNAIKQHQHEFISQAEIAETAGVSGMTVSKVVRQLEEQGIIYRSVPVPRVGTKYVVNSSESMVGPNHLPKNLPSETVPVRSESYDESLIREFLAWRKTKQG